MSDIPLHEQPPACAGCRYCTNGKPLCLWRPHGEPVPHDPPRCDVARSHAGHCGPEGRHYAEDVPPVTAPEAADTPDCEDCRHYTEAGGFRRCAWPRPGDEPLASCGAPPVEKARAERGHCGLAGAHFDPIERTDAIFVDADPFADVDRGGRYDHADDALSLGGLDDPAAAKAEFAAAREMERQRGIAEAALRTAMAETDDDIAAIRGPFTTGFVLADDDVAALLERRTRLLTDPKLREPSDEMERDRICGIGADIAMLAAVLRRSRAGDSIVLAVMPGKLR